MKKEFQLLIIEENAMKLLGWNVVPKDRNIFAASYPEQSILMEGQDRYYLFHHFHPTEGESNRDADLPESWTWPRFIAWFGQRNFHNTDCGLIIPSSQDIQIWNKIDITRVFRLYQNFEKDRNFRHLNGEYYLSADQLYFEGRRLHFPARIDRIPVLWGSRPYVIRVMEERTPIFFFDYDGTLSPIVSRPENALLPEKTKDLLSRLAKKRRMAIISGRDKEDVKARVGLSSVFYAGSHGFEIEDPSGQTHAFSERDELKKEISDVSSVLEESVNEIPGMEIEPKEYAVAVHYRNVKISHHSRVKSIVEEIVRSRPSLKISRGKNVLEVRSGEEWNKGKAMLWIAEEMGYKSEENVLIYVGDDLTDEDAFRIMPDGGISILVGDHGEVSFGDFRIHHFDEINRLLSFFIQHS